MKDFKEEFNEYRARAMAGNEGPFATLTAGYAALRVFIREDWPEVAPAFDDDSVRFKEVGRGHRDGSLEQLTYQVGTDALGWRRYDMTYDRDSRVWVLTRRL